MKIDSNIPEEIFKLFEKYPFESLSKEQQKEVLQTFSREEYDLLFYTNIKVKSVLDTGSSKEKLLREFDLKHGIKKGYFPLRGNVWKYAASILLCGILALQFFIFKRGNQTSVAIERLRDTVYVVKNSITDTIRKYDTVLLKSAIAEKPAYPSAYTDGRHEEVLTAKNSQLARVNELPGLHIMSVTELDADKNKQKKNSIKDDSLLKQIGFVSSL